MRAVSIEHYENFPVASVLCPRHLRPAVAAIYHFARTADDLADEGEATAEQRLQDLQAYRADLTAIASGKSASPRWSASVFQPLAAVLRTHQLPLSLLHDLLDAFEQDLHKTSYANRDELLDYCRRSANPVGRLLLHLYGVNDALALQQSDAICSSLQLINFWQDFSRDGPAGRVYAPQTELLQFGVSREAMLACKDSAAARAMIQQLCVWAEALMHEGAPLVHRVPGRAGWELRLVVQGGLRILAKIRAMQYASLTHRPRLQGTDAPILLWRALAMKAMKAAPISEESL
ncbi:squalene synthase HpnC [Paucibacter sp. Y2R2-4]|uniref:squalene synthase HpnC n=1 Tax=Paucibacter sp. Y2R2-4 TaxID=2893553 RepID=UPI0021E50908|nr:squalene synthase HpnC [Paucibacter sp. Y2R2-4]MCV2351781.1 squalene synthase HpnC [Paucibacter sp. Y2R2-4]